MTNIKKFLVITGIFLLGISATKLSAQDRPIQLALFNPVQLFHESSSITGARFSLLYGKNAAVTGLDLGLVNVSTSGQTGIQWGLVGIAEGGFSG